MNEPLPTSSSSSFPSTQWTQIISAIQTQDGEAAWPALVEFCERYRPAIHRFFLRRGVPPEQAEDYTQAFFQKRILERWDGRDSFLHTITRNEGQRFRGFLCHVLWCFLKDQWKAEMSQKAGGGVPHVPLDDLMETGDAADEETFKSVGREFDRAFALEILRKAAERSRHSTFLMAHLRGELPQKQAAEEMGVSEGAFKQAYRRFRERLARDLWDEVSKLAGPDEKEIRAEIEYLMSLFS